MGRPMKLFFGARKADNRSSMRTKTLKIHPVLVSIDLPAERLGLLVQPQLLQDLDPINTHFVPWPTNVSFEIDQHVVHISLKNS